MVFFAEPTLDNSLQLSKFVLDSIILVILLRFILVGNKVHPDLLSNHSCLWVRSRLVTLRHSKLGPSSSLSHRLGNHLPLDLVGSDHLDLLAVLVEYDSVTILVSPFTF